MNICWWRFKLTTFRICFVKYLGDAQIKEDILNTEGRTSASALTLQSSELPVPVFDSRETKETTHSSFRDCAIIEDKIATDEKKEVITMSFLFIFYVCICAVTMCLKSLSCRLRQNN